MTASWNRSSCGSGRSNAYARWRDHLRGPSPKPYSSGMEPHVTLGTGGNKPGTSTSSSLNNDSFRMTLDLFQTGLDVMRQNLRRRHPEAQDEQIERLLGEWLQERPGAEFGDCPGPNMDVKTFLA